MVISERKHFLSRDTVKGAVVGGVGVAVVSAMFVTVKPASASAAVLLGPLATIQGMIDQYMGVMNDYVDQWIGDLSGLIDSGELEQSNDYSEQIYEAMQTTNENQAVYHAKGDSPYRTSMVEQLEPLRGGDNRIVPDKAAEYLAPPSPAPSEEMDGERMERIWEHALLVTGDEPIPEVSESRTDTLVGTEYEYKRVQTLQGRLLAQDSIQRYPLQGPKFEGYREHLEQYQDGGMQGMTAGQLLAAQLDVAVRVEAASAVDQLESSLRQERMLGALLAQEVKDEAVALRNNAP